MSEPPRLFHFWLDFETTGLNVKQDAILEAGWTITDENLVMLTPLRQRFAALVPAVKYPPSGQKFSTFEEGSFASLGKVVRDMHDKSGLTADWQTSFPSSRLQHPRDFERLVLDDMAMAGFTRGDRLILSGAGVSHFDNRVLEQHFPSFYKVGDHPNWAYWTHDTSVAARTLGSDMMERLRDKATEEESPLLFASFFACEQNVDFSVKHLTWRVGDSLRFTRMTAVPHRAADDVMMSLIDGRILRAANQLTRQSPYDV